MKGFPKKKGEKLITSKGKAYVRKGFSGRPGKGVARNKERNSNSCPSKNYAAGKKVLPPRRMKRKK